MNNKFLKIIFITAVIFSLFSGVSAIPIIQNNTSTYQNSSLETESSHTVFCELAVDSNQANSKETANLLQDIYESGEYDFQYITYVSDQYIKSSDWLKDQYNIRGFPTCFFDGGFDVLYDIPALKSNYENKIFISSFRNVHDLDVVIDTDWFEDCCSKKLDIEINVINNENSPYDGILRIYIVERNSHWTYQIGETNKTYKYAFLDFAINERIFIPAGGNVSLVTPTWIPLTGSDVDGGEIVAIAVLSSLTNYPGYSDPPYNEYSFNSNAVDEVEVKKIRKKVIKPNLITNENPIEKLLQIFQRFLFKLNELFENIFEIFNKVSN